MFKRCAYNKTRASLQIPKKLILFNACTLNITKESEPTRNDAAPAPAVISNAAPAPLTLKRKNVLVDIFIKKCQESYIFSKTYQFVVKLCFC